MCQCTLKLVSYPPPSLPSFLPLPSSLPPPPFLPPSLPLSSTLQ